MSNYTNVFGNSTLPASEYKYQLLSLTASASMYWPYNYTGTGLIVAKINVLDSTGAYTLTMPPASEVSGGEDVLFQNISAFTITIHDYTGGTIGTVAAGASKYLFVKDNSTDAGTWGIFTYGTGTSAADAASLAGYGLAATSSTLSQAIPSTETSAPITVDATTGRAQAYIFTGGSVACTFPSAVVAGADFFFYVKNAGTGTITLTTVGGEFVDATTTLGLNPNESCIVFSTGTDWHTVGLGRSTVYQFTKFVKDLTGLASYTLTSSDASNKLIQFTGAPSGAVTITAPAVVAIYYVEMSTSNSYTLLFKTAAGTGITLNQTDRAILYCDGVDIINAQTASTPASQTTIVNDTTTNATMYPTWVTAGSGDLPIYVSSTKLSFNPSTGMLTATGLTGPLTGSATALRSATTSVDVAAATAPVLGQALIATDTTHATWRNFTLIPTAIKVFADTPVTAAGNTLVRTNSTGGVIVVNLPAASDGLVVGFLDTANICNTNSVQIVRAGADTIEGDTQLNVNINGAAFVLIANGTNWKVQQTPGFSPLAFPLTADVSGAGYFIDNVKIGNATPLAAKFTTVTGTSDATINTQTIGLGAGSVATNTAHGVSALAANTTGATSVAVGYEALKTQTTGVSNTAVGFQAVRTVSIGTRNSGFGYQALYAVTTGGNNTAVGYYSGGAIATGSYNVAIGDSALSTSTADALTAVGYQALTANTTGTGNTAVGYQALKANTIGTENTAVGYQSLDACTTGNYNTAVGFAALGAVNTGQLNTAIGNGAGTGTTSGSNNTFLGQSAGQAITTGANNVYVGYGSVASGVGVTYEIMIGPSTTGKGSNTAFISANGGSTYNGANITTWATVSDRRIKTNVTPVANALNIINALNPVEFDYIVSGKHDVAFIAQEYQEVLPEQITRCAPTPEESVLTNGDDLYTINQNLVPYLVKAIQELSAKVTALEAKLNAA